MVQMIAVVSHKKNVDTAPLYAYSIQNPEDNGFTYQPGDRYGIVWFKGFNNLFAGIDPIEVNRVDFGNASMWGGCVRKFINSDQSDNKHEAFTYVYYPDTKDLYCIALNADEARFGGIVVSPASYHPLVKKFTRHQYLMNKWRRLTPLIGKWASFFNQTYTEVTYRQGNQGALAAENNFATLLAD
jgi:hypothetical protein